MTMIHLQTDEAEEAVRRAVHAAVEAALARQRATVEEIAAVVGRSAHAFKAWLTVDEVCAYLGLCEGADRPARTQAVRRLHDAGLSYVTVQRQRLTNRVDLDEWIAARAGASEEV